MPYINAEAREDLDTFTRAPAVPGELNYVLTKIVQQYLALHGGLSYITLNSVIGVLECMKLELYRRVAVPYEDEKCKENGDVYR